MESRVPLVGRREEFEYLRSAMCAGRGAVVGGAAGLGKTRLAHDVADCLTDRRVRWASVTPAASEIPLGGLAGLDLARGETSANRTGLLTLLTARLLDGAEAPVAVVVDDAHLLDELSAAFVHHLVVSHAAPVLLTIRSGEPVPSPIVSLYKDQHLPRVELQPLSSREFEELAVAMVGGEIDTSSLQRLWALASGNALFLRELVTDAHTSGALSRASDGRWHWQPVRGMGPRLTELVVDRMGRLDASRRSLAELLAVGEPLGMRLVERLVPAVDLTDAERSGLIVADERQRRTELRLAHPMFGEVLRARMPVLQRHALHAQLADAYEQLGARRSDDVLRVALWRVESSTATDPDFLLRAAQRARAAFDPSLSIRLARASLDLAASFEAALVLGGALAETGDVEAARLVLDELVGTERNDHERQALTHERVWLAFRGPNGIDAARDVLEAGERSIADPHVRLLARRDLAVLLTYAGRFAEASSIVGPLGASDMDGEIRLRSLPAIGACLTMAGRLQETLELCDELEGLVAQASAAYPMAALHVLTMRINALLLGGWTTEAVALLTPPLQPDSPLRLRAGDLGYARTKRARIHLLHGEAQAALTQLREAIAVLEASDPNRCIVWALSLSAEAHALLGDLDAARVFNEDASAQRDLGAPAFDGDAARARAWVALCAGERSDALAALIEAAELQLQRGQRAFALFALHDALRLGGSGIASRCMETAEGCDGPWPAAAAAHAAALRSNEPDALERAAAAFAELSMHLVAAEAWSQARRARASIGQTARAAAANRRVQEQLELAETAATPLVAAEGPLVRLTRREQEVASLAASGLTNTDIADRLFVSVRTVESHLYAVFSKLGIADRKQLAATIAPQ